MVILQHYSFTNFTHKNMSETEEQQLYFKHGVETQGQPDENQYCLKSSTGLGLGLVLPYPPDRKKPS